MSRNVRSSPARVIHVIYSGLGGHAAVMFSLLENGFLAHAEHHVVLAGVESPLLDYTSRLDAMGIGWSYVGKQPGRGHLTFYRRLRRELLRTHPDLVFLNGLAAVPAAALLRGARHRPRLMLRESEPVQLKSRYEWSLLALAHAMLDDIVHLTPEAAEGARAVLRGIHRDDKVRIVPNGLDTNFFSYGNEPRPLMSREKVVNLGMISRLQHKKDHITLLEAVSRLRADRPEWPLHLHIAGDGATLPQIEWAIVRLGLSDHVTLHGLLDRQGVRALLAQLDIYVHATFGETMSNSIMQAMAMALPIVASDVDGVSNMVGSHHGQLYPSKDAEALASCIARWLDTPPEAREHGKRARALAVDQFDIRAVTARYESIARGEAPQCDV